MNLSDYNPGLYTYEAYKKIYDKRTAIDKADDFEGEFHRTDVDTSYAANLKISGQDNTGFDFELECTYYTHYCFLEGKAEFAAKNVAIFEYMDESGDEIQHQYVVFERTNEGINVIASCDSFHLGFGENVGAEGLYVQGEPEYTNANILNETFTSDEQEELNSMLGELYKICFKEVVESGLISVCDCELTDGTQAVFYEAFVPTMGGYGFELLITENDDIYYNSEYEAAGWRTNVPGAIDFPEYEYKPQTG